MDVNKQVMVAEAHLYVGVAKADGIISQDEFAQIPYYAKKSQRFYDVMRMNKETARLIGGQIREIMLLSEYADWSADDHLDEAVTLLKRACSEGAWHARVSFQKNESGFLESAKIDGYLVKEAQFIKRMQEKLEQL